MKKYISRLIVMLTLFSGSVLAAEDIIVNTGKAVQFGIWKVFNEGAAILFIDQDASHFVDITFSTNPAVFFTEDSRIFITNTGTGAYRERSLSTDEKKSVNAALAAEIISQLQDGRYRFGDKLYVVSGDTITIFNNGAEDLQGIANPATVLKKFSNGMIYNGHDASVVIDPTVMLDANDTPAPAKILGDCLATYSAETGRVEIPCLSIIGDTTVFHVGQQQIPGTLTFQVNPSEITPVQ